MILFLPWKSSLKIPAVYVSEKYSKVFAPYPSKIKNIIVTHKNYQIMKSSKRSNLLFLLTCICMLLAGQSASAAAALQVGDIAPEIKLKKR